MAEPNHAALKNKELYLAEVREIPSIGGTWHTIAGGGHMESIVKEWGQTLEQKPAPV